MSLDGVRAAYDASADGWVRGPEAVYERLAAAMLARAPIPVSGAGVLDIGAGTAVNCRVALRLGAREALATDVSAAMLHRRDPGLAAAIADAARLPFADASFDLVVAGCCLGHLPDPRLALAEARRVATAVVASAFEPGWTHPAKAAIDEAVRAFGFRTPEWYARLKRDVEPVVDDPDSLRRLGLAAGWRDVEVSVIPVPAGLQSPEDFVDWRFGMAHLAPFVASLSPERQLAARTEAAAAVATAPPLEIPLVVLSAR